MLGRTPAIAARWRIAVGLVLATRAAMPGPSVTSISSTSTGWGMERRFISFHARS